MQNCPIETKRAKGHKPSKNWHCQCRIHDANEGPHTILGSWEKATVEQRWKMNDPEFGEHVDKRRDAKKEDLSLTASDVIPFVSLMHGDPGW